MNNTGAIKQALLFIVGLKLLPLTVDVQEMFYRCISGVCHLTFHTDKNEIEMSKRLCMTSFVLLLLFLRARQTYTADCESSLAFHSAAKQ